MASDKMHGVGQIAIAKSGSLPAIVRRPSMHCLSSCIVLLLLLTHICMASDTERPIVGVMRAMENLSQRGEEALQNLQRRGTTNECWRAALQSVVPTCRSLTEDRRVHFAVALANCHLTAAGLPTVPCTSSMSIAACTQPLTSNPMSFNTYTEFYMAIDSMCYSLQREEVQDRMEATAAQLLAAGTQSAEALEQMTTGIGEMADRQQRLSEGQEALFATQKEAAADTAERLQLLKKEGEDTTRELRQVSDLGKKLREKQGETLAAVERMHTQQRQLSQLTEATLAAQEQLAQGQAQHAVADQQAHERLQTELDRAALTSAFARASLEDLAKAQVQETNEARAALAALAAAAVETHRRQEKLSEVLSRVENLQGVIAGEFLDTHRLTFYVSAFGILILLTATRRLSPVRMPALLLLALNFAIERNVGHSFAVSSVLHLQLQWLIRAAYCVAMVLLFGAQAWCYQDESVRLRHLVSEQTQQTLTKFFTEGISTPKWSQVEPRSQAQFADVPLPSEMVYWETKAKRPASRTPRRRLQAGTEIEKRN